MKESLYNVYEADDDLDSVQYNLVAECDATIHSIVTRKGIPLVFEGQKVQAGDTLVLGQCEIYDDAGIQKEVLHFRADALIYAKRKRIIPIPMSEIEILTLKSTNNFNNERLFALANQKLQPILENLEENGVIILDKNVMIDKEEKEFVVSKIIKIKDEITDHDIPYGIVIDDLISDFWVVPLLIYTIREDYRYHLNYVKEGNQDKIILYIVPKQKLIKKQKKIKRVVAMAPYERPWSNVELVKDCGLIPYLLYKNYHTPQIKGQILVILLQFFSL